MRDGLFGLIEMSIFLGIPLAWGIWELVALRREQARDRARDAAGVRHDDAAVRHDDAAVRHDDAAVRRDD